LKTPQSALPHTRHGFTLTELAIVLSVIGTLLGAIWIASGKTTAQYRTKLASDQIRQIVNGYKAVYAQSGIDTTAGTWTDVTCMGVNAKLFPSDMPPNTACAQQAWNVNYPNTANYGATYPATPWGNGSWVAVFVKPNSNTINIAYNGLSKDACTTLANAIYNSGITYQAIWNGAAWQTNSYNNLAPPSVGNVLWTSAQVDANCGANNNNAVQIGINAR
jgi:prepilin-type N-terminal cleavage/methylation domain-containing protein